MGSPTPRLHSFRERRRLPECPHVAQMGVYQLSAAIPDGKYKVQCELFGVVNEQRFRSGERSEDCAVSIDCGDLLELSLFSENEDGKRDAVAIAQPLDKRLIVQAHVDAQEPDRR